MPHYPHHHGRQSLDEYIDLLPEDIREVALRRRTKDWALRHAHSIPQAVHYMMDYDEMGEEEIDFWKEVYYHYLNRNDLPRLKDYPSLVRKNTEVADIPPGTPLSEMVRIAFRCADRPYSSQDVWQTLSGHGFLVGKGKIRYTISYLISINDILHVGDTERNGNDKSKKLYRWNRR